QNDPRGDAKVTANDTIHDNIVTFKTAGGAEGWFNDGGPSGSGNFSNTNKFFVVGTGDSHWVWNGNLSPLSWSSYRSQTGQDAASTLTTGDASVAGCASMDCTGNPVTGAASSTCSGSSSSSSSSSGGVVATSSSGSTSGSSSGTVTGSSSSGGTVTGSSGGTVTGSSSGTVTSSSSSGTTSTSSSSGTGGLNATGSALDLCAPPPGFAGYNLVFADEFNNTFNWNSSGTPTNGTWQTTFY